MTAVSIYRVAKRAAERGLLLVGVAAVGRRVRRSDTLILAYHNVLPDHVGIAGDASLHLPVREFRRQLDTLTRTHDVVPLETVASGSPSNRRVRAVITFDDAYLGALTVAIPELVRRGLPATIFVAPGLLGRHPWWDVLADPAVGTVPSAIRERALTEYRGDTSAVLRYLSPARAPQISSELRIGTEEELISATKHPGITVGSHTWSHVNLQAVSEDAVEREMRSSADWLRTRVNAFRPWLSYPYGLFDPRAERLAAAAGFVGALRVEGGWIGSLRKPSAYAMPRYNVPSGLSVDGFRLRLGGFGAS